MRNIPIVDRDTDSKIGEITLCDDIITTMECVASITQQSFDLHYMMFNGKILSFSIVVRPMISDTLIPMFNS